MLSNISFIWISFTKFHALHVIPLGICFHELLKRGHVVGIVFFTIRWWDPATFEAMHPEGKASSRVSWPYVEDWSFLCIWLFVVPLVAYTLWQLLYFLIVNVLRRQRLLRDPEVMTSYRFGCSLPLCHHGL